MPDKVWWTHPWLIVCDFSNVGTFRAGAEKCTKIQEILESYEKKRGSSRRTNQNKVSVSFSPV